MPIDTGHKWFGQRILLESTGDEQIDTDLCRLFTDEWDDSGPLEMTRADVRRVLAWMQTHKPPKTGSLFE